MATKKKAKTASKKTSTSRTAKPGESAAHERARTDAQTAKGRDRTSSGRGTESAGRKRSVAEHSEHPESTGDSTVRHALPTAGAGREGQKGFPQGEYDVTKPKSESAKGKGASSAKSAVQANLDAHLADQDVDAIKKKLGERQANRLSATDRALAIEGLPTGAVIEHEGPFRWRVKGPVGGANRFGHGQTFQEAVENFILGSSVGSADQAAAEAFHNYPSSVQKEITERDRAVAERTGTNPDATPEAIARREFAENQKAARSAKAPAPNASTDGPEIASAQLAAGAKRGRATQNRQAARKRTGGKARR